jgi:hypothetical protein
MEPRRCSRRAAATRAFSRAENAPTSVPFLADGDKAIVMLHDDDELDTTAPRLATRWASTR